MQTPDQSIGEEIANSVSHGIGALLCLAGLILLTVRAASGSLPYGVLCCVVFGASALLLYLSSTLYHSLSRTKAFRFLRSFDHCSIYLLIAGTYTPFTLLGLRGSIGWTLFAVVWSCAVVGVVVKAFVAGKWELVSTLMYLAMGWLCLFAIRSMYMRLPHVVFAMLLAGGVCYTLGVPFYASRRKYMHLVWHLWVLAGTGCHYAATWLLVR